MFGVTRIVNFAHGSFYMLGAYFARDARSRACSSSPAASACFWPACSPRRSASGCSASLMEAAAAAAHLPRARAVPAARHLRRRARRAGHRAQVLGPLDILGPRAPGLARRRSTSSAIAFPSYELFLIAVGPAGARAALASDAQDALRRAGAGRDAGSRDGRRRSASTRRCCLPARCSSAPASPGSAARCRPPSSPPITHMDICRSSPRLSW